MEVRSTVTPAIQVHPSDAAEAKDRPFHSSGDRTEGGFLGPFIGALRLGSEDGTLTYAERSEDTADVVFNTGCWGYVHLRHRHRWARKRARSQIIAVLRRLVRSVRVTVSGSRNPSR